jgi:hypothetical protein
MSNSPINFTAEILQTIRGIRAQQQAAQRAGIARGVNMFYGNDPAIEALMQQRGLGQYGQSSSKARANAGTASITGSLLALGGSLGGADPNNVSATGFNPNTGTTTPTYNNLDSLQNSSANTTVGNVATDAMAGVGGVAPQVQTGSFSPNASIAAEGIFGSEESRGIQPYKKPLINF